MEQKDEDSECFYRNAVKILEDSEDEEPPAKRIMIKDEILGSGLLEFAKKQIEIKSKETEGLDVNTRRGPQRRSRRQRNTRGNGCAKNVNTSEGEFQLLNIIEINDSPARPLPGNTDSPVEGLRQNSDLSDIVALDSSVCSVDADEVEVAIHVKWRGKCIEAFHLKKSDPLKSVFERFAQLEGVSESQVLLTHNGKPIYPRDSSEKFDSGVIILDGSLKRIPQQTTDTNQIELSVLRKDNRRKLSIFIVRSDTMEVFMDKTANELNVPRDRLQFVFDGERINVDDTPESLDLEGGECIEVTVR